MTKARELDPITIEVLKNALVSAADVGHISQDLI
jgi:hypothetical protein